MEGKQRSRAVQEGTEEGLALQACEALKAAVALGIKSRIAIIIILSIQ